MSKVVSAAQAVAQISDGAMVAVNSSSGLCCPDAVLAALGERGAKVTYVTERCVIEMRDGALVVTETAPGVDLKRDVVERADMELTVADDVREMDPKLFSPEPIGLAP